MEGGSTVNDISVADRGRKRSSVPSRTTTQPSHSLYSPYARTTHGQRNQSDSQKPQPQQQQQHHHHHQSQVLSSSTSTSPSIKVNGPSFLPGSPPSQHHISSLDSQTAPTSTDDATEYSFDADTLNHSPFDEADHPFSISRSGSAGSESLSGFEMFSPSLTGDSSIFGSTGALGGTGGSSSFLGWDQPASENQERISKTGLPSSSGSSSEANTPLSPDNLGESSLFGLPMDIASSNWSRAGLSRNGFNRTGSVGGMSMLGADMRGMDIGSGYGETIDYDHDLSNGPFASESVDFEGIFADRGGARKTQDDSSRSDRLSLIVTPRMGTHAMIPPLHIDDLIGELDDGGGGGGGGGDATILASGGFQVRQNRSANGWTNDSHMMSRSTWPSSSPYDALGVPYPFMAQELSLSRAMSAGPSTFSSLVRPDMQDTTAFSAPPLTQLNYLASTSPEVAKSVLRNRGMLDAVDPSVFGGGPPNGKKRSSDVDAGRVSSPEPVEDSEDEGVEKDDPPYAKRRQDNQRNLRVPIVKTIKLVPPMMASSREKRSTKKAPLPPPTHHHDLKGPSAFPSLLTDLSKYKPSDGIKPLGRGFSKGKEDAIPGAFFECENCGETKTPLWRRSEKNELLCNACGLYVRTHGEHRPIQQAKASRDKRTTASGEAGDYSHRKRKSPYYCTSCKSKPAEGRPASCPECEDVRRLKAEKMPKGTSSSQESALGNGQSETSTPASQTPMTNKTDTSTSPIVSVGGRRGKQPPGAGRQLPRGASTASPPTRSSQVIALPPAAQPPAESPKKIMLKMRWSTDASSTNDIPTQSPKESTELLQGLMIKTKTKKGSLPSMLEDVGASIGHPEAQGTPKRRRTSASTMSAMLPPIAVESEDEVWPTATPERRRKRVESLAAVPESGTHDRPIRAQRRTQSISVVVSDTI